MTPEGKVKAKVKAMLKKYPDLFPDWPVPSGFGKSTLDCNICAGGRFIAVETKAPGQEPTDRQKQIMAQIKRAGGDVFVIDSVDSPALAELEKLIVYYRNRAKKAIL